jgi:hypothetical protein
VVVLPAALTGFVIRPLFQNSFVHKLFEPRGGDLLTELGST